MSILFLKKLLIFLICIFMRLLRYKAIFISDCSFLPQRHINISNQFLCVNTFFAKNIFYCNIYIFYLKYVNKIKWLMHLVYHYRIFESCFFNSKYNLRYSTFLFLSNIIEPFIYSLISSFKASFITISNSSEYPILFL